MPDFGQLLHDASFGLLLFVLVLSELGLPVPETPLVIAIGVISQRLGFSPWVPLLSSSVAVLLGDVGLYYLGRAVGSAALDRRPLRWLVPERALPRIDELFERHGSVAIFVARFLSGIRFAAFALAGMRGMPIGRFVLWDGAAIVVTVPVFATLGFLFASSAAILERHVAHANRLLLAFLGLVVVAYVARASWRRRGKVTPKSDALPRTLRD